MHWEYTAVTTAATGFFIGGKVDATALIDHLNALGAEGWELVSTFDSNKSGGETRDVFAILKRPVPETRLPPPYPAAH